MRSQRWVLFLFIDDLLYNNLGRSKDRPGRDDGVRARPSEGESGEIEEEQQVVGQIRGE